MPAGPQVIDIDEDDQRHLAARLFNHVWAMLEREDRSAHDDEMMVDAAHASRFLWETVGDAVNHARGDWQISRVYVTVGRAEPALHHARLCLDICIKHEIEDFDLAFAHEAMARASALAGAMEIAAQHRLEAERLTNRITDIDDRELLLGDIATLPV